MHSAPQNIDLGPQVQPVPFRLFCEREPLIRERKIIVQAANVDGAVLGQQAVYQEAPAFPVIDQRIAIIRERQSHDPFSQHIRDPAKRDPGLWLLLVVE
jgi:hypothetical protein